MLRPSLVPSVIVVFLLAAPSSGSGGPDPSHPVTIGSARLTTAPLAEMERRIDAAWLRDEAETLGLPAGDGLRWRVADALAGRSASGIPGAFNRFHERHRAATHCLAAATDPYADRCIDQPAAPGGSCRWMGEATLCRVEAGGGGRIWLVLNGSGKPRRHRRHAGAVAELRRIHLRAREVRARAARDARAARASRRAAAERPQRLAQARADRRRSAAERRQRLAQARADRRRSAATRRAALRRRRSARRARLADPRLSTASLSRARPACARFRRESELYVFGLGTQDPVGQANGLLSARATLRRRLIDAAAGRMDRDKLGGLLGRLRDGDRWLRRLRGARELREVEQVRGRYARAGKRTGRVAARLGLPGCAR